MSSPSNQRLETLPPDQTLDRLSDSDGQQLQTLFEQWARLHEQGSDVSVAQLCQACPHLAEPLAREIALHRRFEPPAPAAATQPEPPVKTFSGLRYQPV